MKNRMIAALVMATISIVAMGKDFSYKLPILAVIEDEGRLTGKCESLSFSVSRDPQSNESIRLSISEDVPAGVGATIRSHTWLAVLTCALQRQNPLIGMRVSIDFRGFVDGPSAGGVIALALLTAIDGRDFPNDFAMTGTIMPDGTIGPVGGIAQKIEAAAKAGKRRICIPEHIRFEEQNDGTQLDLLEIAKKNQVELFAVEDLQSAYRIAHNLPPEYKSTLPQKIHIDSNMDGLIKKLYQDEFEYVTRYGKDVPKEFDEQVEISASIEKGKLAFSQGKLLAAFANMRTAAGLIKIYHRFVAVLNSCQSQYPALKGGGSKKDYIASLSYVDASAQKKLEAFISSFSGEFCPDHDWMQASSAQLETVEDMAVFKMFSDMFQIPQWDIDAICQEKDEDVALIAMSVSMKLFLSEAEAIDFTTDRIKIAKMLPQLDPVRDINVIEKLFFNVQLVQYYNLELEDADLEDLPIQKYYFEQSVELHKKLEDPSRLRALDYHAVATVKMSILSLVSASTLLLKRDMAPSVDNDGKITYGNSAALGHIVRNARTQAMENIKACQKAGIPCYSAIEAWELAETSAYDNTSDMIDDVLTQYWNASLMAQAMMMIFVK